MSARRKGRELALQVLYQGDMSGEASEQVLQSFAQSFDHTQRRASSAKRWCAAC